ERGTSPVAEAVGLALFVAWYVLGIPLVRRGVSGAAWFVVLTLLWTLLVLVSPENVWLAFPLWLLAGHLLPLLAGTLLSLAILVVVAVEPARQVGETTFAAVIGPFIGMVVALGISRAQMAPVHDGRERPRLIASLRSAQAGTAAPTDEPVSGPCIGMVAALAISRAQRALVHDGMERQRLFASPRSAQGEAGAPTDELARVQRAEGATSERTRLSRDIHDGIAQGFS